jgi:phosphotriesterase-related protein
MPSVETALGPIDTAKLGFTLMHEHVLIANWSMRAAFEDWIDLDAHVEWAASEVRSAKERGVGALVDLTPINLGRDVHTIRRVAEIAQVPIVVATGFYWTEEVWMAGWEADALAPYLVRDITQGVQATPIKAAIIKCATDHLGVTELNRKVLQITARAHRQTGVPISTHTSVGHRTGLAQQDVFAEEGVDLSRVIIGHCGDTADLDYLQAILDRGSVIGMDRFGLEQMLPTEQRVSTIVELCKRGYADRMVLSHDACCHLDFFAMDREQVRAALPKWNFRHIPDDVIPALRKAGVSEREITSLTVDTPRRIFERQGAY